MWQVHVLVEGYWRGTGLKEPATLPAEGAIRIGGGVELRWPRSIHGLRPSSDYRRVFAGKRGRHQMQFVVAYFVGWRGMAQVLAAPPFQSRPFIRYASTHGAIIPADSVSTLEAVSNWVAGAARIVALTGAGISTESGIPDFRGPQGVWTKDPKAERLSNIHHYMSDPEVRRLAWQSRLEHPAWTAQPNDGHRALVELETRGSLLALVTQNIDELHQRAGHSPKKVIEVHGTVHQAMPAHAKLLLVEAVVPEGDDAQFGRMMDLNMMVMCGGKERTEPEWRQLLTANGFALSRVIPMPGPVSLVEAVKQQ